MRYRRPSLAACAATVCLITITGCGGSATERFRAGYAEARAPLKQIFVDIASTFTDANGKSMEEIAHSLGALADRFARKLAPLEALQPPGRDAVAFRTLTASLKRVESDLRETAVAANHRDVVGAQQAITNLESDVRAATDAEAAVTHKLDHR